MKGISPLIATVMLIAFALFLAGIIYGWVSQFVYTEREELQVCSKASITIQKAYKSLYNKENENINMVVYNTGEVPLKGFSIIISYKEDKVEINKDFLGRLIEPKGIGLFTIKYNEGMESVVVQALECKNAQDMINIYDVEGLKW
jgi:flagellin-like protein